MKPVCDEIYSKGTLQKFQAYLDLLFIELSHF